MYTGHNQECNSILVVYGEYELEHLNIPGTVIAWTFPICPMHPLLGLDQDPPPKLPDP